MEENNSSFGKGYAYCLALFLAHKDRRIVLNDYSLWFDAAADHLREFDAKTEEEIEFKQKCLALRLCDTAKKYDYVWAIKKAENLLISHDIKCGVDAIKAEWN